MRIRFSASVCRIILAASLLSAGAAICGAQEYNNTPVTVSKEKVRIGGKVCYSHIVMERQTLYSISKAYGVSVEDIYRFNPTLKETGLKKNSIIIIPSEDALKDDKEIRKAGQSDTQPEQEEVAKEPAAGKAQQAVMTGRGKSERKAALDSLTKATPSEQAKGQTIHVRKWYEDLDMIAQMYGVSVEAIMTANNLSGRKLSNRQRLIIPAKEVATAAKPEVQEVVTPEAKIQEDTLTTPQGQEEETPTQWYLFPKNEVHATVLLPLTNAEGEPNRNNMDFYSGILLAVRDLGGEGVNTTLSVYDIADPDTPVTKEDVEDSDLIIGPVTTADLTRLFQTSSHLSNVISPLDPRAEKLVREHPGMVQVPAPHKSQYEDAVKWIREEMGAADKVFMVYEKGARINESVRTMKEVMDSSGLDYTPFSYSILEGRDVLEPLKGIMTAEGANRVFIASESEAFVNDVIRNLNLMLLENFEIVLYASSKIRSFDTIEVDHFHKTSMHVSLSYYIDYEDQAVKDFLLKYRALYNTEPTQFAFQGYDVAHYFINLCNKYGKRWPEKLEESEKAMLQSTFKCIKQGTGGYVNTGVRRIIYDKNWSVKLLTEANSEEGTQHLQ